MAYVNMYVDLPHHLYLKVNTLTAVAFHDLGGLTEHLKHSMDNVPSVHAEC